MGMIIGRLFKDDYSRVIIPRFSLSKYRLGDGEEAVICVIWFIHWCDYLNNVIYLNLCLKTAKMYQTFYHTNFLINSEP